MILKILIILAVLAALVLIFAATRPNTFHVERSIRIAAPPERVFALINDLHNWSRWAPQDREDPTMTRSFSGAESGVGAVCDWSAKGSAGKGRMEIVESVPSSKVAVKVDFIKPLAAHNVNQFVLTPDGSGTSVTWSMSGSNLYIMKVMSVVTNMDKMMGKHFEDGLANLKGVAEK